MKIKTAICFDDVLLTPRYSDIKSRSSDVKINSWLGDIHLQTPIISSPMDTITESSMSRAMGKNGGLGIIHRYCTIEEHVRMVTESGPITGAAIGATGDYLERAQELVHAGTDVLCVDIAHGHHEVMRFALGQLRKHVRGDVHIMAGNVATLKAFNDLSDWGADSVRVGVGGGSICSTRIQTGHGVPTLQSIVDCANSDRDAIVIADGGIKSSGDIVKALAAGADFVMLGSLLAGCDETPGELIYRNGLKFKTYRGMASIEAQVDWRGHTSSVEGVATTVPFKGPARDVINSLCAGIRSGLSYSGARSIRELHCKAEFIRQTSAGAIESSTHIKNTELTNG